MFKIALPNLWTNSRRLDAKEYNATQLKVYSTKLTSQDKTSKAVFRGSHPTADMLPFQAPEQGP